MQQLKSAVGMDYTKLRDLLSQKQWREADRETRRVMLAVSKRPEDGGLTHKNINDFPCEDLRTIDGLWVQYSNGRFGFSVQKEIYFNNGGQLDGKCPNNKVWYRLCEAAGWRVKGTWLYYDDLTFDTSAPRGHLPCITSWVMDLPVPPILWFVLWVLAGLIGGGIAGAILLALLWFVQWVILWMLTRFLRAIGILRFPIRSFWWKLPVGASIRRVCLVYASLFQRVTACGL
ncbi:GUN4 domain-containing protein [Lyngbya sp. CCY1209]|uniref:GUN4 domain-containing protein n=1 Tax=Lyngbya sp. CCY1209 TaxID=2886103 RepID=UPI002D20EAC9|nr:GUN4 domain-containing protein [Lyngbya sp. CCY1209]MEB3886139.1 GUN4 domain-containing protein [Lyngbya sp. CCY1209]